MEYTEHNGVYYIAGRLQIRKTPDGWTIFRRRSLGVNEYDPVRGQHYESQDAALEAAERMMKS